MPITNDEELDVAVNNASNLLQEIQDYVKRDFTKSAKIRFPRGHIRQAAKARTILGFLEDKHLKSNISYIMMLSDVQHWILVRTDLSGTAKEMVVKLQLFLYGSIIESATKVFLKGKCGGHYGKRVAYLEDNGIITNELRVDLEWLWELRNKMHLFQLYDSEWLSNDYSVRNHNRAVRAFKKLIDSLNNAK